MGVADELCEELFRWLKQQETCANDLMTLAHELEKLREVMTVGQFVGNTATVLGSATLVGTGIATLLTGGLALPLLAGAAGITVGAGTVTSFALSLVEKWKSSDAMKNAEKTAAQIEKIRNNIERLQKKLSEECESQDLDASSSDEVQFEITARILRAMARRSGRDLPLSRLRHILRSNGMYTHYRYPEFNSNLAFFQTVSLLLGLFGFSVLFLKTTATKGAKVYTSFVTEGMAALSLKTVLKGTGQVTGGLLGLVLTVPDLVDNCEELIKNKHQTEASSFLKQKADEIREAVKKLKKQLNELQEMLSQIPETECHIEMSQEMIDSEIYTRGTICMEYKPTQKQGRKIQ
ncbi:FERM domain-containing 7-like protein, partial [Clarias magur]